MTPLYTGTRLVLSTDPYACGTVVKMNTDYCTVLVETPNIPLALLPGRIESDTGTIRIPLDIAATLQEVYSTNDPVFPVAFHYFPKDAKDFQECIGILLSLGYVTQVLPDFSTCVSNLEPPCVIGYESAQNLPSLQGSFCCKSLAELQTIASYRRPNVEQLYIDCSNPQSDPTYEHGNNPRYRLATISEVVRYLIGLRNDEQESKSEAVAAEDVVATILHPTGLIGTELCLPYWDTCVFTRIDSIVGPYAYFRIGDNCSLELPETRIVQEFERTKLYVMSLDEALRYESYMVDNTPIAHVQVFNGDVEKYTQLMRDLGYAIKGGVEKGNDAYFSTRSIDKTRTCLITYGTDAALSYDCGRDWDLFYAISMIGNSCAPAYMVDEQGRVFKNDPEHAVPSRFLSIQEIVAHLRNDLSKKKHSSERIECCCKCHQPVRAGEVYFVWDEIKACLDAGKKDYVCPRCFEESMGRPIQLSDLKRRYKVDLTAPTNAVGQLILENIEFAYTKGWIHE